ncbi:unnamed protein product [Pleuronectes platessa]|uniref:Uncharacterized protein n=1 Tax=Pleuronectes platessa TaxID=8262 RepID=A0A9N7Y6Q9_PLEPL|nr:unnamed protein product [Pleuronectes platessa]
MLDHAGSLPNGRQERRQKPNKEGTLEILLLRVSQGPLRGPGGPLRGLSGAPGGRAQGRRNRRLLVMNNPEEQETSRVPHVFLTCSSRVPHVFLFERVRPDNLLLLHKHSLHNIDERPEVSFTSIRLSGGNHFPTVRARPALIGRSVARRGVGGVQVPAPGPDWPISRLRHRRRRLTASSAGEDKPERLMARQIMARVAAATGVFPGRRLVYKP